MALATLDLVAHDDARPAFPAVYLEGHTVLSYGELAGLAGESGRVLRHADRLSGLPVAIQDGDGTRPLLFLIHPDNGRAGPYGRLAYGLGEEFAVSGIQAGGLYSGAEPRRMVMAGALDDVRLVAAIGTGLLEPPDTGTESWWDEPPRQPGAWPARCANCSADQR
ncbi:MAG: hypothetical protein ABSB76_27565 [Streptosporangiaceae bacterium]